MKFCKSCETEKNNYDFYKKGKKGLTISRCKKCFNTYCMERWKRRKIMMIEQFGGVCLDCHQTYHYSVFEFHHTDPLAKEYSWAKMRQLTEVKLQTEIRKCVMLCANCHRMRHWDT